MFLVSMPEGSGGCIADGRPTYLHNVGQHGVRLVVPLGRFNDPATGCHLEAKQDGAWFDSRR